MSLPDIKELKVMLQGKIVDLCLELLPKGRRNGKYWVSNNPIKNDWKHKPALKVSLTPVVGAWKCWRSGDASDILGLVAYIKTGNEKDQKFARNWALDWLGLRAMTAAERRQAKRQAETKRQESEKQEQVDAAKAIKKARLLFLSAEGVPGSGHPAERHVRAYFRGRNCPLEDVPHLVKDSFRFSSATEYWTKAQWRKNERGRMVKIADGPSYPALHSILRSATGHPVACHVTFLDLVQPVKALEDPPKLIRGPAKGAVIPITHGYSGLAHHLDIVGAPVVLAEGIETAVTLATVEHDVRIWACGSMAGMGSAPVDLPCVSQIIIARDNNAGNDTAQEQFARVIEQLEAHRKPIAIINSPVGDDFNDLATQT